MFEVGVDYVFHVIEDSTNGSGIATQVWTVDRVEGTLLKVSNKYDRNPFMILNTASSYFVKAVPVEKSTNAKLSKEAERWVETTHPDS